jgi:DNA modification methylase
VSTRILVGDVREQLRTLPDESVHCVVTSPPYWGLRDYGTASWKGGEPACDHTAVRRGHGDDEKQASPAGTSRDPIRGGGCRFCGATRIDAQIGLEPTPDEYVATLVDVFREVRRVLRKDGTLWLVLGDAYSNDRGRQVPDSMHRDVGNNSGAKVPVGLKPKDLIGLPWRVAFALQQPYHVGPIARVEDRAWLAAMLDSDGCLGIRLQHPRLGRGTNETYIPYLSISQTDTGALEHCVRITGVGRVNVKASAPAPGDCDSRGIRSNRTFYTWRLDGQQASAVIRDVYPHLIIKKAQAQLVYAMNESLRWGRPTRSLPVPPDVMETRRRFYAVCKRLNQRDPIDLPRLPTVPSATEPGWYLRCDIVWSKPNPMPESVTDRPTRAHEYVFLLSRSQRYYYDAEAIREPLLSSDEELAAAWASARQNHAFGKVGGAVLGAGSGLNVPNGRNGRNNRSVWTIATEPYVAAHFATFPQSLVEPCILASTSAKGVCSECGAPWVRVVARITDESKRAARGKALTSPRHDGPTRNENNGRGFMSVTSVSTGWQPSCTHNAAPTPATVLDPFAGSGTTLAVANRLDRHAIGIELSPDYAHLATGRIARTAPQMLLEIGL